MKIFIKRLIEPSLTAMIFLIIGSFIGLVASNFITKEITMTAEESYKKGYEDANKHCIELIKQAAEI